MRVLLIFSFLLKISLAQSNKIFGIFEELVSYWLPIFIDTTFFQWKLVSFIEIMMREIARKMFGINRPVNIKYHIPDSFKQDTDVRVLF